jgi:hypothetical protein
MNGSSDIDATSPEASRSRSTNGARIAAKVERMAQRS